MDSTLCHSAELLLAQYRSLKMTATDRSETLMKLERTLAPGSCSDLDNVSLQKLPHNVTVKACIAIVHALPI